MARLGTAACFLSLLQSSNLDDTMSDKATCWLSGMTYQAAVSNDVQSGKGLECHANGMGGEYILSEISLPVRCRPLELALLVPVIVNLPFFLFLIWHLHSSNVALRTMHEACAMHVYAVTYAYAYVMVLVMCTVTGHCNIRQGACTSAAKANACL